VVSGPGIQGESQSLKGTREREEGERGGRGDHAPYKIWAEVTRRTKRLDGETMYGSRASDCHGRPSAGRGEFMRAPYEEPGTYDGLLGFMLTSSGRTNLNERGKVHSHRPAPPPTCRVFRRGDGTALMTSSTYSQSRIYSVLCLMESGNERAKPRVLVRWRRELEGSSCQACQGRRGGLEHWTIPGPARTLRLQYIKAHSIY
jgi:hypothetical protein